MNAGRLLARLRPPVVLYGRAEAMLMRLCFAVLVWFNLPAFDKFPDQPTPVGLAAGPFGIDFTFANDPATMSILKAWLLPLLLVYILGYVRWLPLLYMLILSLAVGTLKNSQHGEISHRFQVISMILMVQCGWHLVCAARWLAARAGGRPYLFHHGWNVDRMEVFVSQSAIAAIYLTTAITKMIRSGGGWMWQIQNVGVDLQKTWGQDYYNTLSQDAPAWAVWIKDTVTMHPWVAIVIFGTGAARRVRCGVRTLRTIESFPRRPRPCGLAYWRDHGNEAGVRAEYLLPADLLCEFTVFGDDWFALGSGRVSAAHPHAEGGTLGGAGAT